MGKPSGYAVAGTINLMTPATGHVSGRRALRYAPLPIESDASLRNRAVSSGIDGLMNIPEPISNPAVRETCGTIDMYQ